MMTDERLMAAKLLTVAPPNVEGLMLREVMVELQRWKKLTEEQAKSSPPCDCAHPGWGAHEKTCSSGLTYEQHVEAARLEWRRASRCCSALRALTDAVGSEIAFHPGSNDRTRQAFEEAQSILTSQQNSDFPGDDGLPF